jgi:hypothetical protein
MVAWHMDLKGLKSPGWAEKPLLYWAAPDSNRPHTLQKAHHIISPSENWTQQSPVILHAHDEASDRNTNNPILQGFRNETDSKSRCGFWSHVKSFFQNDRRNGIRAHTSNNSVKKKTDRCNLTISI